MNFLDPIAKIFYRNKYLDADAYTEGYNTGLSSGKAQGKQEEYDRFWDAYQQNGQKQNYSIYNGAFAGSIWTDDLFHPKYPMVITDATMMFRQTGITDLTKPVVELDFSNCIDFKYAFAYGGKLKKLPTIDMSRSSTNTSAFADFGGTELSLIFSESTPSNNIFSGCSKLETLTIDGTIGQNGLDLHWATDLSQDSLLSVLRALKDYSGDTSGTVWKVTLGGKNLAKLTEEEIGIAEEKGWVLA